MDVQRITLNTSCMTISGGRTEQLDIIIAFFCRVSGFTSDFLSFIVVEHTRFFQGFLQLLVSLRNFENAYVSVRMLYDVRVRRDHVLCQDRDMYHEDTDTPAVARTSNLNEELGQVWALQRPL